MIEEFKQLVKALQPVKTKYDLIRVGGDNDGGYLLPDDLSGITECFSPGVDVTATFEQDLLSRGIRSHLADASVDGPPNGLEVISFQKKFVGSQTAGQYISLEDWVKESSLTFCDLILQMDIEGGEYTSILATPADVLKQFRIIAIEVHNAQHWFHPLAWGMVKSFFDKLMADFYVVHFHPNNNCPFIQVDDVLFPSVFELTLLRKDRAEPEGFVETFPHPLDQPNVTDKPVRHMPEGWYK
jgi:hypothetical protein